MKSPNLPVKIQYIIILILIVFLPLIVYSLSAFQIIRVHLNALNISNGALANLKQSILADSIFVLFLISLFSLFCILYFSQHLWNTFNQFQNSVEELVRQKEKAEYLCLVDELTNLYNYRYLRNYLSMEIKKALRYNHPLTLIMLDIDNFKHYNDCNGHSAGNLVLSQFAHILLQSCRETDMIARYGGEEFSIVLPETDTHEALLVAEKIRNKIEAAIFPLAHKQPKGRITASMGLAVCPKDALSMDDLFEKADQALYWAKENGKNQAILYSDHLKSST